MPPVTAERLLSILLVEDEPEALAILARMIALKFPNIKIHTAANGEEGLAICRKERPELVITDINMPFLDGIRMAGEILADHPGTLIIVLTAHSDTRHLLDAIELGITYYVLKPINQRKLFAAINQCLTRISLSSQIREQQEHIVKLSLAVERSPNMVVITDRHGTIEYVNSKFRELTGFSDAEIIGQGLRLLQADPGSVDIETQLRDIVKNGLEWRGEEQSRKKSGEIYWEAVSISPIIDSNGNPSNFVVVKEDISARKLVEARIETLNTNLAARAAELEEVNQELEAFSYTISHDLRSPLTAISGFSQLLRDIYSARLDDEAKEYLLAINDEALRMNQLIATMLNFSRLGRQELHLDLVDLSNIAHAVVADLQRKEPDRSVSVEISDGLQCTGDPALLRVVLENLLGNAWKYTGRTSAAKIEFAQFDDEADPAFYIRDNGAGFDMAQGDKLFLPFQRLHLTDEFTGHGIGLATVERIIKRHGGKVWAEGEKDKGATFYFSIGKDNHL